MSAMTINFQAITAGSSVGTATATTDVQGLAATTTTLGTAAGTYEFHASIAGAGTGGPPPVSISASALAGAATTISKLSGDAQSGTSGQLLTAPLVADSNSSPGMGEVPAFGRPLDPLYPRLGVRFLLTEPEVTLPPPLSRTAT